MAKRVLSIVIGTECTKVCEISYNKFLKNKGIRVYRSISFHTPKYSVDDGLIRDMNRFGDELAYQLKEAGFKSDKVIFSVASGKIANREVIIPPVKDKKIMDIIRTGAADYFPIDMSEYVLSYLILDKNTSGRKQAEKDNLSAEERKLKKKQERAMKKAGKKKSMTELFAESLEEKNAYETGSTLSGPSTENRENVTQQEQKNIRLSVYAVPSSLVMNYYSFAKFMHFDIVAIDYSGNSSYQMIKRQVSKGISVFVQLNEQDTLISIIRDGVLLLQRQVNYGVASLTGAVMEQHYYKADSEEEAWALLSGRDLLNDEEQVRTNPDSSLMQEEAAAANEYLASLGLTGMYGEEQELIARQNIRDSLRFLSSSIARMLDYYRANNRGIEFNMLHLTGAGIGIQGIDRYFTDEIGITTVKKDKLTGVSSNKTAVAFRQNPSEFMACIGAVLRPIDFVPLEYTLRRQKRSAVLGTVIFAFVCLVGSIGLISISYMEQQEVHKELKQLKNELSTLPIGGEVFEEYGKVKAELNSLEEFIKRTYSNNDSIKEIIEELENKLPSGTILGSMQFNETNVFLNITLTDSEQNHFTKIAKLMLQLKAIEYFNKVEISGIMINEAEDMIETNFSVTCTY